MLGVRWSPPHLALHFIAFSLLSSYNEYEISQLPLPSKHMGLSNLIRSYTFNLYNYIMTISNLIV